MNKETTAEESACDHDFEILVGYFDFKTGEEEQKKVCNKCGLVIWI